MSSAVLISICIAILATAGILLQHRRWREDKINAVVSGVINSPKLKSEEFPFLLIESGMRGLWSSEHKKVLGVLKSQLVGKDLTRLMLELEKYDEEISSKGISKFLKDYQENHDEIFDRLTI